MGATDHGTQEITIQYYEEATSFDVNKRNVDIVPRGIYSGGHLAKVSNTEVTLSQFTAEIGDDDIQISVRTSTPATLKASTLDSGDIDPAYPYLVMRWAYVAQQDNYVEIHAIASVSAAQDTDIIIGKCVFSGSTLVSFDYAARTFLNVQNNFLKVEATEDSELYIWVKAGKIQLSTGTIHIAEQKVGPFSEPSSPNSRIDLVYVTDAGALAIAQGTAAVSPSVPDYGSKLVLAEVRLVNGDVNIVSSRITDVRPFITGKTTIADNSITSTQLKTYDSGWFAVSTGITYTKAHGLGSLPFMVQLWFSDTSDGSGMVVPLSGASDYAPHVWADSNLTIVDVDSVGIKIRGQSGFINVINASGVGKHLTSGYARIKAIL